MLIRYDSRYRKIAMGLLSFTPREQTIHKLKETIAMYENESDWELYFWVYEGAPIGIIGIHLHAQTFAVQHISLNPSFRSEGIGYQMVQAIQEHKEPLAMCSTTETKTFLEKCWEKQSLF